MNINSVFKVKLVPENPYNEPGESWNCYIDVCICAKNNTVSIQDMMLYNDLPFSYYEKNLNELIQDGYLNV